MSDFEYIVVGAGVTGVSVARYLRKQGATFAVVDNRIAPPGRAQLEQTMPDVKVHFGDFDAPWCAKTLVLSPGIASEGFIGRYGSSETIGDVELFVRQWDKPIIAITGTNGKSTLVSLIHHACTQAGIQSVMIGNIGTPVLDRVDTRAEVAVIEMSSFQLLTTHSLRADVALVLNVTPDHLDRHGNFNAYVQAKQRIFTNARSCVVRADDPFTEPPDHCQVEHTIVITKTQAQDTLSIKKENRTSALYDGEQHICNTNECQLRGAEVAYNLLTAYAVAKLMRFPLLAFVRGMMSFGGLPHRMQHVATLDGVDYINDSKATNVGATIKAISTIQSGRVLVLLGGDGKDADFMPLVSPLRLAARLCVVYGTDERLASTIADAQLPAIRTDSLQQAVCLAHNHAQAGDTVLLSPACASFDQFAHFVARGDAFMRYVQELANKEATCTH